MTLRQPVKSQQSHTQAEPLNSPLPSAREKTKTETNWFLGSSRRELTEIINKCEKKQSLPPSPIHREGRVQ